MTRVIVTGGLGYIGSHICVELAKYSSEVLVLDNLTNSTVGVLRNVQRITSKKIEFIQVDIRKQAKLNNIFKKFRPDAVIHLAGLKSVSESILKSPEYFDVNVSGGISVLNAMDNCGCKNIIFSSSATVYGVARYIPIDETHPVDPGSPYGQSKLIFEDILKIWSQKESNHRAICLRYFNPVGAHESLLIGDNPLDTPNNLMPYICRVAIGELPQLNIFGADYETRDGSGERDYIHVCDLANGHILVLNKLDTLEHFEVINLGTGKGTTVQELIKTFSDVNEVDIPFVAIDRRPGDVPISVTDVSLAKQKLNFSCQFSVNDMCYHAWNYHLKLLSMPGRTK